MIRQMTFTFTFLAIAAVPVAGHAHDLVSLNGRSIDHQHVHLRGEYGEPLRQGHYAKPPGSTGIVIWSAGNRGGYGQMIPIDNLQRRTGHHHHHQFHHSHHPIHVSPLQRQFEAEAAKDRFGHTWGGDD